MKRYTISAGKKFTLWWGPYLVDIEVISTTARKVCWRFLGVSEKHKAVRPSVSCPLLDQETFKNKFIDFLRRNSARKYKEITKKKKGVAR